MKLLQPLLFMSLIVLASGCQTRPDKNGIPNFGVVDSRDHIYRGGQPTDHGWAYLESIGVDTVIKLNPESEGADNFGLTHDLVEYYPISFREQMFGGEGISNAVARTTKVLGDAASLGIFVHCSHGQDRTGLVIACYRVKIQGWTKADAEKEMLAHGFHKELIGLWEYWKHFDPEKQ